MRIKTKYFKNFKSKEPKNNVINVTFIIDLITSICKALENYLEDFYLFSQKIV